MLRRRTFLQGLGAGVAALGLPGLGGCGGDDGDGDAPAELSHIVVVCMENRSYDHFLGGRKLAGLPQAGDGLTADLGNPDAGGTLVKAYPADVLCVADPPHGWSNCHAAWNGGAMDGFLAQYEAAQPGAGPLVMQYMTAEQLPWTWAMTAGSAVCDHWFSAILGSTWPNRFFLLSGQSGGIMQNITPDGGCDWPSVLHRCNDAGVPWSYYFTDLPVVPLWQDLPATGNVTRIADFYDDAAAGTLAPVTIVDPGFTVNDDHPPHFPMLGQQFLASIYAALADSPQWRNVLLVITYDEHGGFYDHVAPPTTPDDRAAEGFGQLGIRVPTLVTGGWVKQGQVVSTVYNHASVVKHICTMFDLPSLTMRDAAAADLSDCLDPEVLASGRPAAPLASLPAIMVDETTVDDACFKRSPRFSGYVPCALEQLADARPGFFGKLDHRRERAETLRRIAWELERRGLGGIRRGR
jgi:phospholipase C